MNYKIVLTANVLVTLGLFIAVISNGCGYNSSKFDNAPLRNSAVAAYDDLELLFGDPHIHTNISDGDESPDFALRFARDVADLDWAVLTDHAWIMVDDAMVGESYYRSIPNKYNEDGKFSVLFGYEWTSPTYNHRNVYSVDSTIPILSSHDPLYDEPDELWAAYEGYEVLTVPHHPLLATDNNWWEFSEPGVDVCVEFYSKWGNSLYYGIDHQVVNADEDNGVLQAIAERGLRLGIMGGSDTHMSRPGVEIGESRPEGTLEYARPGLTGVWATAHTREAIFDAIKNRHCYGTRNTRVHVEFSVNGSIMGSEITSETPPEIEFELISPVNISKAVVYKLSNGVVLEAMTWNPDTLELSDTWTDDTFTEDAAYMLIVDLENTDMAVTSPVWVEFVHSGDVVL